MSHRSIAATFVGLVFALAIAAPGCGDSTASSGGGPQLSGLEKEARDAAMGEIQKRWKKDADGWTTARVLGSAYAPDRLLRQVKDIVVTGVETYPLSESDKLNGFEWTGEVKFQKSPAREAGDPGIAFDGLAGTSLMRQKGAWTQWVDFDLEAIRVQKNKGKWTAQEDTWLLRGTMPTSADYANAGVK